MDTVEFLREKKLLGEDNKKFKIIHDEAGELVLNEIMDEYAEIKSKDSYMRLYAEFENYKKRVQKEKDELIINTKAKMLNSILELSDLEIFHYSIF